MPLDSGVTKPAQDAILPYVRGTENLRGLQRNRA
jgi:hypothetical protein